MRRPRILAIAFPVFAIIGIGWRYARVGRPVAGATNQINAGSQPAWLAFQAGTPKGMACRPARLPAG